jgi:ABC-type transporter Mla subunit MlaD
VKTGETRSSQVMTKPLPQILDEMDQAIEAANKATAAANAAAAEARQAGQEAAESARVAGEKAAKQVGAELEAHKQENVQSLAGIDAAIKFIKGIIRTAGNVFTGIDKE